MESQIGLYKTELIKKHGPWKTLAEVELATAEYVEWLNSAGFPLRHQARPAS
jgi:putative transposase